MSRTDRLSKYRTSWVTAGAIVVVTYVTTMIVEATADTITLRNGGWQTVTTKRKLNQASQQFALGYGVHQVKGEWFLDRRNPAYHLEGIDGVAPYWLGLSLPFVDGMTFPRNIDEHLAQIGRAQYTA